MDVFLKILLDLASGEMCKVSGWYLPECSMQGATASRKEQATEAYANVGPDGWILEQRNPFYPRWDTSASPSYNEWTNLRVRSNEIWTDSEGNSVPNPGFRVLWDEKVWYNNGESDLHTYWIRFSPCGETIYDWYN